MGLEDGITLGRYQLLAHAGAGGMGEVYRAHDTKLDRVVALKLLPSEMAADTLRMHRFVQEAKTASSLNHPNILTIYEIDQAHERHFIATEFIDGLTLRQKIRLGEVSVTEALDISIQVASALAAAHAAGIAHRDIKPENIMLRRDAIVKVLDFGLAKPTERIAQMVDSEADTIMQVNTSPGVVMGTISYMSPEQARGYAVDARTDVWSLGVVLYEMLAGEAPFTGATTSDMLVAVLDREPPPLPDAPAELQRIVRKALRKDREERYQTVKDMLTDLRELKHELEFQAKLERTAPPHRSHSGPSFRATSASQALHNTGDANPNDTASTNIHTTSSAEYIVGQIKQHKRGALLTMIVLTALAIGWAALMARYFHRPAEKPMRPAAQPVKLTRLTNSGRVLDAAISPDGQFVAYVAKESGLQTIIVRQVANSGNITVVPPEKAYFKELSFTPDGSRIYYLRAENGKIANDLCQVATLGGTPRKVIHDVDSAVTFAPDGRALAYLRHYPTTKEAAILVAQADGTGERKLAVRSSATETFMEGPAWSPDGQIIAAVLGSANSQSRTHSLLAINAKDGAQQPIGTKKWRAINKIAWLKESSELLLNAQDDSSNPAQLWRVAYPSGEVLNVTNDFNTYFGLSAAANDKALVTVQQTKIANIWVGPGRDVKNAQQVTSGVGVVYAGLSWTPDGKIVFGSNASGNRDIWLMNADGSGSRQITNDAYNNSYPTVSPDGRFVVYVSERMGQPNLWRVNLDGSPPKQITDGPSEFGPSITPDGQSVIYFTPTVPSSRLWKVSIDGGPPQELTQKTSRMPMVSPDGKYIAASYWDEQLDSQMQLAILPITGGTPLQAFTPHTSYWRWASDSRALIYIDNAAGYSNLMLQPLAGGPPKPLTDFKSDWIFAFDFSRDGKQLALLRGAVNSDVVLVSDFK